MVQGTKIRCGQLGAAALLLGQTAAGLVTIGALVFAPRTGEAPALLYPLSAKATSTLPLRISNPDTLLIARGRFDGSLVVAGPRADFATSLLRDGILILNAVAPGCGPVPGTQRIAARPQA